MKVLLINPDYPETYWSLRHALPLVKRRWLVAPLSLVTVAALLPRHWELRHVDLAVRPLRDEELRWADLVMCTGMLVQRRSLHAVLARCRRLGVRTVVGGPAATALPGSFGDADHLFLGECEDGIGELCADLEAGRARRVYREEGKPDLANAPVPRFDLLERDAYQYLPLQFSRGCPFLCEFCDIITLYGRNPRAKSSAQVIAELEAIRRTGFRGRLMFVDDNFVGNRKQVKALLPEVRAWRERTGARLDFFTQVSIDLADDPELVDLMTAAGFAVVFVGVETPMEESLRGTRKHQNLRRDMAEQLRELRARGLDTWGGFILGFDQDPDDAPDRMIDFVQRSGIAYAMVGMLTALPGTPLWKRLEREGRLRPDAPSGDNLAFSNFVTRRPADEMAEGYIRIVETLYDPETYFARCRRHLEDWRAAPGLARPTSLGELPVLWRSLVAQGIRAPYRRAYWRFLAWVLRHHPSKLPLALAQAVAAHHYITYTRETVVPAMRGRLAERDAEEQRACATACASAS